MSVTQIAEKAGVSIATVSRVLNNSRPVDPKLAERVRRAMEELGLPARQVRRRGRGRNASNAAGGKPMTIAIVAVGNAYRTWFELPVIAAVVAELTRAAQDHHMGVLMTEMADPRHLAPVLRRSEVDGAIAFVDSRLSPGDMSTLSGHLPVVRVMGGQLAPADLDHVGPDNNAVGYLAAQYLLKRGLRDIACLTMRPEWDLIRLRAHGFLAAAAAAHVNPHLYLDAAADKSSTFCGPNVTATTDLALLIEQMAARRTGRLGLFVTRDEETVLVYPLLRRAGLEPGRDVVVVSCDNEAVRLSTLSPRPASIDLGSAEIARHAVRRLATRIKHRDESPVRLLVNPHLVEGDPADVTA